jgi:lipopolysaccharide export system protein LptC
MGKLHYFTALLLIILLAVASGWIFKSIENNPILTKEKPRHDPDYFLKNFTSTTMNNKGDIAYQVKAKQLEHYPDDGSMKLLQPTFSFYENNIKIWTAQANEALILQNNEKIHLEGNVILQQILNSNKNSIKNEAMILTAKQLTIEPEKSLAHTKSNIKLHQGNNYIQALGMRANLSENRIEFLSKTRSYYVLP